MAMNKEQKGDPILFCVDAIFFSKKQTWKGLKRFPSIRLDNTFDIFAFLLQIKLSHKSSFLGALLVQI